MRHFALYRKHENEDLLPVVWLWKAVFSSSCFTSLNPIFFKDIFSHSARLKASKARQHNFPVLGSKTVMGLENKSISMTVIQCNQGKIFQGRYVQEKNDYMPMERRQLKSCVL